MENFIKCATLTGKLCKYLVQLGCVGHCTFEHVGDLLLCTGSSMEPNLHDSDIIVSENFSKKVRGVKRNDIVVSRSVDNPKILICKRVAALEGDLVLYYKRYRIVPAGHVWLLGDNRGNSNDSRDYGPVPLALVKGRVICRIWPFNNTCIF